MNRILIGLVLLALAAFATACSLFSSEVGQKPPAVSRPTPQVTLPLPVGGCQSRLGGRVTNVKTRQSPAEVVVEVASSGKTLRTKTDPNGLYGFAGLCAGQYALSVTPPGGKAITNVGQVNLDGAGPAKLDVSFQ